jgi:isoleucyl-tRNA synthetase
MPEPDRASSDRQLADKWDRIFRERSEVLKALELARAGGLIGHSLDARVTFEPRAGGERSILAELARSAPARLRDLLIVSQVAEQAIAGPAYESESLNCRILVSKAEGAKCERCWKYDPEIGKDQSHPALCPRCAAVLSTGTAA